MHETGRRTAKAIKRQFTGDEPDSTTDSGGRGGGFGSVQGDVKEGYGPNIHPMIPYDPWKNGGRNIRTVIKQSRYLTADFVTNQTALIIPYQFIYFWGGGGETIQTNNQTIKNYNAIKNITWGQTWIKGKIKIELYTVTRQRLLQQGSTNTLTYDFETSQNLFFWKQTHKPIQFTANTTNLIDINGIRTDENVFDKTQDIYEKYEIPQRHTYEYEIHFPKLSHGYTYNPATLTAVNVLIPGPTQLTKDSVTTPDTTYSHNQEFYNTDNAASTTTTTEQAAFANRTSWPAIGLAQPVVPDETGIMKFQYQIRLTTELEIINHIKPDFTNGDIDIIYNRQQRLLPFVSGATGNYTYTCIPYEIKN